MSSAPQHCELSNHETWRYGRSVKNTNHATGYSFWDCCPFFFAGAPIVDLRKWFLFEIQLLTIQVMVHVTQQRLSKTVQIADKKEEQQNFALSFKTSRPDVNVRKGHAGALYGIVLAFKKARRNRVLVSLSEEILRSFYVGAFRRKLLFVCVGALC